MCEVTDAQCNFAGMKRICACYSKFALVCARTQLHDIPPNFAIMYAGRAARAAASLGSLPTVVSCAARSRYYEPLKAIALGRLFCMRTARIQER